jgi:hypothetical protein
MREFAGPSNRVAAVFSVNQPNHLIRTFNQLDGFVVSDYPCFGVCATPALIPRGLGYSKIRKEHQTWLLLKHSNPS